MKDSKRPAKPYAVYILLGLVFVSLILTAVFLPQAVYGIYDDYQFNLSSRTDKNLSDSSQLNKIYEPDRAKRLAAYTGGLNSGKKYITIETDVAYDEELDNTIKNLIRELDEQLFQTNIDMERVEEIIESNKAVDAYVFFTLSDFVPYSEELYYADSSYVYSCIDKSDCRRFMIYDESMSDGIAFSLLYMTIELKSELKIELIGDTYDSTIYYVKFSYPYDLSVYELKSMEKDWIYYECFEEIMSEYYSADKVDIVWDTQFIEEEDFVSFSENLSYGDNDLTVEIRTWYNDEYKEMVNKKGIGIKEIAEAVGVMDIN